MKVIQIGNIAKPRNKVSNPQEGRVYSPDGLAPSLLATMATKVPKIIEYDTKDTTSNK